MTSFIHALNVGTLAIWLSFAGFGTVGIILPLRQQAAKTILPEFTPISLNEITLGEAGISPSAPPASEIISESDVSDAPPSPPETPTFETLPPLPEVPTLPIERAAKPAKNSPVAAPASSSPRSVTGSAAKTTTGSSQVTGTAVLSEASRLAAGRMYAPSYPAEAKRKNQSGTVNVGFTVDSQGRVISAYAKSSSGWPLLDAEAIRTVRRWSFPPGNVMKMHRAIIFQLN
jgi:TonB family protein